MKRIIGKLLARIALAVTKNNVDELCIWFIHQPRLPAGTERLKNDSLKVD